MPWSKRSVMDIRKEFVERVLALRGVKAHSAVNMESVGRPVTNG